MADKIHLNGEKTILNKYILCKETDKLHWVKNWQITWIKVSMNKFLRGQSKTSLKWYEHIKEMDEWNLIFS